MASSLLRGGPVNATLARGLKSSASGKSIIHFSIFAVRFGRTGTAICSRATSKANHRAIPSVLENFRYPSDNVRHYSVQKGTRTFTNFDQEKLHKHLQSKATDAKVASKLLLETRRLVSETVHHLSRVPGIHPKEFGNVRNCMTQPYKAIRFGEDAVSLMDGHLRRLERVESVWGDLAHNSTVQGVRERQRTEAHVTEGLRGSKRLLPTQLEWLQFFDPDGKSQQAIVDIRGGSGFTPREDISFVIKLVHEVYSGSQMLSPVDWPPAQNGRDWKLDIAIENLGELGRIEGRFESALTWVDLDGVIPRRSAFETMWTTMRHFFSTKNLEPADEPSPSTTEHLRSNTPQEPGLEYDTWTVRTRRVKGPGDLLDLKRLLAKPVRDFQTMYGQMRSTEPTTGSAANCASGMEDSLTTTLDHLDSEFWELCGDTPASFTFKAPKAVYGEIKDYFERCDDVVRAEANECVEGRSLPGNSAGD